MSDLKYATLAMSQPETTKMFVGGLSWETNIDTFTEHFKNYGEITDSVIMKDIAGKPRGFGFVTFKDPKSVGLVLAKDEHWIDGKQVDPKIAEKRGTPSTLNHNHVALAIPSTSTLHPRKIFVGGIPPGTTEQDLSKKFDSYGNVTSVEIKVDKESQRPRGFGFLTLDNDDSVQRICKDQFFFINGKKVECKLAQDPGSSQEITNSQNLMGTYPCYTDPAACYYYAYGYGGHYGQYYPFPYGYNYSAGEYNGFSQEATQRSLSAYFSQTPCQGPGGQQQLTYSGYYPIPTEVGQSNGGMVFSRQKNGGNNSSQSRGSNSSGNHY
ncbi:Heterogeneous nuclear ribonucleoprotein 27C-like [Oopsacas minuta]|uniref:Heterogeneous nuclear ribonucleoprotein 27C-like n=1 Tax=Oopsacas minuta TaxID=111878 RepID=A0AAV7KHD5_9METZ|nr:Heterogeneous nuclear ribonucleoprotein 27C-like [Oopsacas minuta]